MRPNLSKYRLALAGGLIEQFFGDSIKILIETWANESGGKNVSSGVIRAEMDRAGGVVIYSCHFDSSHWTGIDFKGFDVKNPGVPQIL